MSRLNVTNFRHPDGSSDNLNFDNSARTFVGGTSSIASGNGEQTKFQVQHTDSGAGLMSLCFNSSGGVCGGFHMGKSRGTTVGSYTSVASGDTLGRISWSGADGTDLVTQACEIIGSVDGTPGSNDMPGRISFWTTPDGSSTTVERARINSSGDFLFNSGFGSVATAYGVRAWASWRGDITSGSNSQLEGSGNVSSITDNGTGDYTINFTNAMPDIVYAVVGNCMEHTAAGRGDHFFTMYRQIRATGNCRVNTITTSAAVVDDDYVWAAIIR